MGAGKPAAKDDELIMELHLLGEHDTSALQMISAARLAYRQREEVEALVLVAVGGAAPSTRAPPAQLLRGRYFSGQNQISAALK